MTDADHDIELEEIVSSDVEVTERAARVANKLARSFNTRLVRIYSAEPLHIGHYDKWSSTDTGALVYLQHDERMTITTVKQRTDPSDLQAETDDGKVAYIEAKDQEHVESFR